MQEDEEGGRQDEEFVLIDGRLLGRLLFPYAMAEIERVPPANDADPADPGEDPPRQG